MTLKKRGKVWYYDFGNHKYRGAIPEARTKHEAEQAEVKLKRDVFEGKYGKHFGMTFFADFVGNPDSKDDEFGEGTLLEWARVNKRSWKHDRFRVRVLRDAFKGKRLGEITPAVIERFKNQRLNTFTVRKKHRSKTSVNRELEQLSKIFFIGSKAGAGGDKSLQFGEQVQIAKPKASVFAA